MMVTLDLMFLIRKWKRYILLRSFTFLHICCYFRYVMRCLRHGCTRSSLNFWSGLTGPPWCLAPGGESRVCRGGGRRGGGPAQLGAGDLGSLLRTLSTGALLLGPEGVVGCWWGVGREAAQLSLGLLLAVLGGAGGLFVLLVRKF